MRKALYSLMIVLAAAALTACSRQPAATTSAPPASASKPAATASPAPAANPSPAPAAPSAAATPVSAAEAGYTPYTHPSGFQFNLPSNWKVSQNGDFLEAEDPSGEAYADFTVPKNIRDLDTELEAMDEELARNLRNMQLGDPARTTTNGMTTVYLKGTGVNKESGREVEFEVGVFEKAGKVMLFYCETDRATFAKWDATFEKIFQSIR